MGIYNLGGGGGAPELQAKEATPLITNAQQIILPDEGYDGLSKVTVNPMPTGTLKTPTVNSIGYVSSGVQTAGYFDTSATSGLQLSTQAAKTITPTTYSQTAVAKGKYTTGDVTVGAVSLQSKTVSPSSLPSTITQDSGYVGLSSVTFQNPSILIPDNIVAGKSIFGVNGNSKIAFPVYLGGSRTDATTLVLHMYEDQAHSQSFSLPTGYNYLCIAGMNLEPQTAGGIGSSTISNFYYGGDWNQFYRLPMSSALTYGLTGVNFVYGVAGQFWDANTLTATIQSPFMTLTKSSDQYSFSSGTWNGTAILFGFN